MAENLIVFSDPRGGSTWITELINRIPDTAVLWEPLHLAEVNLFRKLGFAWRQFIPEDDEWPEAERAFEQVFRGKVLNHWTCRMSSPMDFLRSERMVVKICRANALIPWLTRVFSFRYEPVYLVRHPFAVAASQMKHGSWDAPFTGYSIPDGRFNEPYRTHADFLLSLGSKEEALVATWCLTNMVPLTHKDNNRKWITVFYENLVLSPGNEIQRIFQRWGLQIPENILEHVNCPSATAKENMIDADAQTQLSKWKLLFDQQQIERMLEVLRYFTIDHYSEDAVPSIQM
ncbi:MAG: sulfotransferase domain-containing protein [Chlorobium sp.]|nr:sulfotransferase domain-containing protein [Chlorobium sp.]